jgi:uncharacterized membrane protein YeiB
MTDASVHDRPFDHAPAGRTSSGAPRIIGLDVTRGLALVGVVVMNYHGYLNGGQMSDPPTFFDRLFHPWNGVLSTRFAATFVLVAGMGVTLMTNRSRAGGDRAAITNDRWRLLRRGLLLYAGGYVVEWIWSGTILFFYGAYFMIAAFLFTLRTRWLVAIGSAAAIAGAAIAAWRVSRDVDGYSTSWLDPLPDSPRNLLLRTFVGHTHPLLPWLAFLCAGMVIGRALPRLAKIRPRLLLGGLGAVAITYAINAAFAPGFASTHASDRRWAVILSTRPFDRGLLYTIGTLGSSIAAFCIISWIAERVPNNPVVVALQRAGQLTLTLYLLHVFVFNFVVDWMGWVQPFSLGAALALALAFWVCAIALGAWWQRMFGQGPLERLYRGFSG